MLDQIAGITRVRMLYLQLLYRCNFSCRHCFHGELLKSADSFSLSEAQAVLNHFADVYQLEAVTFLGGEPLLYPHIVDICAFAKQRGLTVEICTNAHSGFRNRIRALATVLDKFRVSLDGLETSHDAMRQHGSFGGALEMVADWPFGHTILALTALGLIAFGLFAVVEACLRPMRLHTLG